jgi:hypothetical protein
MVMSSNIFAQRYVDGHCLLCYLQLFNTINGTLNPSGPLAQAALNPWQASSEEGQQSSDFLCSLRQILPSSPTTSFSKLKRRAVHQGQLRI